MFLEWFGVCGARTFPELGLCGFILREYSIAITSVDQIDARVGVQQNQPTLGHTGDANLLKTRVYADGECESGCGICNSDCFIIHMGPSF